MDSAIARRQPPFGGRVWFSKRGGGHLQPCRPRGRCPGPSSLNGTLLAGSVTGTGGPYWFRFPDPAPAGDSCSPGAMVTGITSAEAVPTRSAEPVGIYGDFSRADATRTW